MHKPSPALIIACFALFLSLGGVSYGVATGFIDSREIKNNTIRSKDIRNGQVSGADIRDNRVRGADVDEASLGQVPSAASAGTATTAASATHATTATSATNAANASNAMNAGAVGGVRQRAINVQQTASTPLQSVFSYGGLVIRMECASGGGGTGDLSFALDTTLHNAEASVSGFYNDGVGSGNVADYAAPPDFDPGELTVLGPGVDGAGASLFGRYEVNYIAPSGSIVSASFAVTETANPFGGTADCILYGHARQSG
jgi:hypothetical protein